MRTASYPVSQAHTMLARVLLGLILLSLGCLEAPVIEAPQDMAPDLPPTTCRSIPQLRTIYCADMWECGNSEEIPPVQGCDQPETVSCGDCPTGARCLDYECR